MNNNKNIQEPSNLIQTCNELLEYAIHIGKLNQKPVFNYEEYNNLHLHEDQLTNKIGVQTDLYDNEGNPIWLQIERLKRIPPPPVYEAIKDWISVKNDPTSSPDINNKIIRTLPESNVKKLLNEGIVDASDISKTLNNTDSPIVLIDVIFRLEKMLDIRKEIKNYLENSWSPWSVEETPRRETIKIYDSLFNLQQTIQNQADTQTIELVWGIGVTNWLVDQKQINHPLLEKYVEIEIDTKSGIIRVAPRHTEPCLEVGMYLALENQGVETLVDFTKKHFLNFPEDIEFSPFVPVCFESILRQASSQLSESGIYWPDQKKDISDRTPPSPSKTLTVTDCWLFFARPRKSTNYIEDIEKFKERLSTFEDPQEIPPPIQRIISGHSPERSKGTKPESDHDRFSLERNNDLEDLFFPKPYNDAQVQIINKLNDSDGVVVQGPPGTGKTHSIANIICHYLASGKSVLVTSKGEPALEELREHIPEKIRNLTISLLTNEQQGMKQLENAIKLLSFIITDTNPSKLIKEVSATENQVKKLKREINFIEAEIRSRSIQQLKYINKELSGTEEEITPMQLAEMVIEESGQHKWLIDELGPESKFNPKFSDSDIAKARKARKELATKIVYVGKSIPQLKDLPNIDSILSIHDSLLNAKTLNENAILQKLPKLSLSINGAIERAEALIKPLNELSNNLTQLEQHKWLQPIFYKWADKNSNSQDTKLFEELLPDLKSLIDRRYKFITSPITIENPKDHRKDLFIAIENLILGKNAFGIFSFGKGEIKKIISNIHVEGRAPNSYEKWNTVKEFLNFQEDLDLFTIKWNSIGEEYSLPKLEFFFGDTCKSLEKLYRVISNSQQFATIVWKTLSLELNLLLPNDLNIITLLHDQNKIIQIIDAIKSHTTRIKYSNRRKELNTIVSKLKNHKCEIAEKFVCIIAEDIGNCDMSNDSLMKKWQDHIDELEQIHQLLPSLEIVNTVSQKISASGAPLWANQIMRAHQLDRDDPWTPSCWYKSWQWKRRLSYLNQIECTAKLKELAKKHAQKDKYLKQAFSNLVEFKTHIGLHNSMTEKVQSSLIRFCSAIMRIGKGTGKRASRYRREAHKAMQGCYAAVPCWIMPTWRISESLPSEFNSFDLVIIDEASQSDISALPAILRAKKILIVGDDRQVSPTEAFLKNDLMLQLKHNFLKNQPFEELLLPGRSIYDLACTMFPAHRIMLKEHFRCVEPIIRFSMQFYSEPLIPLRIPKTSERLDPPLIDIYVPEGKHDRNKINEAEIDAIIEEIRIITNNPKYKGRSIGVISLVGTRQARAIQDRLFVELGEEIFQKFNIICGNASTMQGKEKDIIFLSMVAGPGQGIAMTKREYEQRFNVAMSRARDRVYLIRSITENDLRNVNDLRLKLIQYFKNPMPQQKQTDNPIELCESNFERDVYKRLINLGYSVTPQVHVGSYSIDLVVEGENDLRLAIELDGDKYHPPEKWAEDYRRQRTMERVGWKFWRCWGSSYQLDPEACINDLIEILEKPGIKPIGNLSETNIYTEHRIFQSVMDDDENLATSNDILLIENTNASDTRLILPISTK